MDLLDSHTHMTDVRVFRFQNFRFFFIELRKNLLKTSVLHFYSSQKNLNNRLLPAGPLSNLLLTPSKNGVSIINVLMYQGSISSLRAIQYSGIICTW